MCLCTIFAEKSLTTLHNSREKARRAQLILDMNGNTTYIRDPSNTSAEVRSFAFDHAYWSFDGYKDVDGYLTADPAHKNARKFCDQVRWSSEVVGERGRGCL